MRRRTLALIALVGIVALAGCSGGTTTVSTATDSTTEALTADQVQSNTIDAMESVESYHLSSNTTIVQISNNREQQQEVVAEGAIDRSTEKMQLNQTISAGGITQETSVYFLNGSIYEYNPAYASQYGSEWVTAEADAGFFNQQDTLTRQQAFLENATVTLNGTETLNGSDVRVLDADVDENATREAILNRLGGASEQFDYNVTNVEQRLWVDSETDRPLRSTVSMNATVTAQGQTIEMTMDLDITFEYDRDVSITLPEGAESAASIGNSTAS